MHWNSAMNPDAVECHRGEGDPLSVDHVVNAADRDLDFDPESGTVRHVAGRWLLPPSRRAGSRTDSSPGNRPKDGVGTNADSREPIYQSRSFERWATTEGLRAGSEAVADVLREAFGTDHGLRAGVSADYGEPLVVVVTHQRSYDRRGAVAFEPTIEYDDVVPVAPAAVSVSLTLDDSTRSTEIGTQLTDAETQPTDVRSKTVESPVWVERQEEQLN